MTSRDFCYWLQGYSEIHGEFPNPLKIKIITDHLEEVDVIKDLKPKVQGEPIRPLDRTNFLYC